MGEKIRVRECHCFGILCPKQQNVKLDSKSTITCRSDGIGTPAHCYSYTEEQVQDTATVNLKF